MAGRRPMARTEEFRWRALVRAPRCVWLLTVAFLFLLVLSTALYPPYRGPDEPLHVDLAVALNEGTSPLWSPASRDTSAGVQAGALLPNVRLGSPQGLADVTLADRDERPSYTDLGGDLGTGFQNQLVQHPPAYYALLSGVLALMPGWQDMPFDRVVGVLRLVTVLLVAPLPLIAYHCARRMGGSAVVPVTAAVMVLGVPQLVHIGGAVNNDNLLQPLAWVCTVLLAYVATGDVSRRTAVSVGAVLGLGLLAKGLMLVFVGVLALAYGVAWLRTRDSRAAASGMLALALAFVIGGWWWLRNLVAFGRIQPAGRNRSEDAVRGWGDAAWQWVFDFTRYVNLRYWFDHPSGSFTGISVVLSILATAVVAVLVVTALWPGGERIREYPDRAVLAVLALPMTTLYVLLAAGSYESFTLGVDQPAFQGRYLFGGIVGMACVAAVGWARWFRGMHPVVVLTPVLAWCGLAQSLAVFTAVRLYWWPADGGLLDLLRGMTRVMPWDDGLVLAVVVAAMVTAAAAAIDSINHVRATGRPALSGPGPAQHVGQGRGDLDGGEPGHGEGAHVRPGGPKRLG